MEGHANSGQENQLSWQIKDIIAYSLQCLKFCAWSNIKSHHENTSLCKGETSCSNSTSNLPSPQ
jgi:hypothetical protein